MSKIVLSLSEIEFVMFYCIYFIILLVLTRILLRLFDDSLKYKNDFSINPYHLISLQYFTYLNSILTAHLIDLYYNKVISIDKNENGYYLKAIGESTANIFSENKIVDYIYNYALENGSLVGLYKEQSLFNIIYKFNRENKLHRNEHGLFYSYKQLVLKHVLFFVTIIPILIRIYCNSYFHTDSVLYYFLLVPIICFYFYVTKFKSTKYFRLIVNKQVLFHIDNANNYIEQKQSDSDCKINLSLDDVLYYYTITGLVGLSHIDFLENLVLGITQSIDNA